MTLRARAIVVVQICGKIWFWFYLQESVKALYHFRDHYFENFGIEKAVTKNDDIKVKMEETVLMVESLKGEYSGISPAKGSENATFNF